MIYIYSEQKNITSYWKTEFQEEFKIKIVEENFYVTIDKFNSEDVLILDLDHFETIEQTLSYIKILSKKLNIIALVDVPKLAHGTLMIKKGCKSYIGKRTSKIIIREVIKTVIEGNVWIYPELMNYIIKNITVDKANKVDAKVLSTLSPKELEVANLVALGSSNKEIAQKLDIQLVTVKKHIGHIFTKLNVRDRIGLAIFINQSKA